MPKRKPKPKRRNKGAAAPKLPPGLTLVLGQAPTALDAPELAVLVGMTTRLTSYAAIPGFDPATAIVSITFESGRVGTARLQRVPTSPDGGSS